MADRQKISVLMPTYNDSKYIPTAIQSVLKQTYQNWELIIVDDGSTDDTHEVVRRFEDSRITYTKQGRNQGQLNALMKAAELLHGKYVTIVHSDDELADTKAFEGNVKICDAIDSDGIFGDHLVMNAKGQTYGLLKVTGSLGRNSPALTFLRGGSNIINDTFWTNREGFRNVLLNYITWNMPYWLKFKGNAVTTLNLTKVRPWYKYRQYSENYIRSDVGRFETVNGCLRAVLEIGSRIAIPLVRIQMLGARVLKSQMRPFIKPGSCSSKCLGRMVENVIVSRFKEIPESAYFRAIMGFYSNIPSERNIELNFTPVDPVFLGKDSRIFYNLVREKQLPPVYENVLDEAVRGFGTVTVKRRNLQKAKDMMRFLNLLIDDKGWKVI